MNSKIIIGIVVLVLVVAAVYLYTTTGRPPEDTGIPSTPTGPPSPPTIDTTTQAEISALIGEEYSILIQEELDKLSVEQPDFNTQTQDNIANDISQFYYT